MSSPAETTAAKDHEGHQSAAHVSPVTRLYRHALESVFGFLELADLSRVLSVSRSWSAAVRSMKSICAVPGSCASLHIIAASALAPHIASLCLGDLSSSDPLLISRHFVSLTSLSCTVDLAQSPRVTFPSRLRSLSVELMGGKAHVSLINNAIVAISRLPSLVELSLTLPQFWSAVSFASLAAAPELQTLTLLRSQPSADLALHQLDQLRTLSHLRKMIIPVPNNAGLTYLLRLPHSLQWQEIHTVDEIDAATAASLSTLPTLTTLETYFCRSVMFLPALTRLRSLTLRMADTALLAADIAAGLASCVELTDLKLEAQDVTSKHLSQALSQLPRLQSFTLRDCFAVESLSFLSECSSLAQTLLSLEIHYCINASLHSTEIKHVLSLKSLTVLTIYHSFVEPLDALTLQSLKPPSLALPTLKHLWYHRN